MRANLHHHHWVAALIAIFVAASASAQVDCSNPDNLCTGDPCTTGDIEVQSPCVVDFSPRTLIVGKKLVVPDGGTLDLTAGGIEVKGKIAGRNDNGAQITLTSAGGITLRGMINASGRTAPGAITLSAAGDIELRAKLNAKSRGGVVPGGTVTVAAGGLLTSKRAGRIIAAGRRNLGGQAELSGDLGVSLAGRVDTRGDVGGVVVIASTAGDVVLDNDLRLEGKEGTGGNATVTAGGNVTINDDVECEGETTGGSATVTAGGDVTINDHVDSDGGTDGGTIAISGDTVTLNRRLRARGKGGTGGIVSIESDTSTVLNDDIDADADGGGCVKVSSTVGNVSVNRDITAGRRSRSLLGGRVVIEAGGDVTVAENIRAEGQTGGSIKFDGTNLTLPSRFDVRSGGTIEGVASGNLTASGEFVTGGGCIGLSAGGTPVLSGDFDVPVTPSCPPPLIPPHCPF